MPEPDPAKSGRGRWRVTFLLEEWDEMRDFYVDADSEQTAIEKAEREHPWEADISASTTAVREP